MASKKSADELDAELAALEAELAALEAGEAPPKAKKARKKAKKPAAAPPRPPPAAAPPEGPAAEAKAPRKRFGLSLPFGKAAPKAAEAGEPAPEAPAEPAPEEAPAPEEVSGEVPEEAPAPPPKPAPRGPGTAWEGGAGAWRARRGPQRVEVLRRELDASGHVVAEESLGEESEAEPAEAPREAPRGLFGFLGRGGGEPGPGAGAAAEADAGSPGERPPPPAGRKSRRWIAIPVLLVLAVLLLAVLLPALGVDPLGVGRQGGFGGGAPPAATFTPGADVVAIGLPLTFRVAAPEPGAEYNWDFGDGSGAQGSEVSHAYGARGSYTVTLTARGASGRTATHAETVQVLAPPAARIAVTLGGSPLSAENSPVAGEELAFSGAGSTADGSSIATHEWQFGDGARASGAEATHAYAAPGSYRATLRVADGRGLLGNATQDLFVGLRTATAGEVPASVQGRQAVNATVAVTSGGGALPYAPVRLRATLTWNATGGGPGGLPVGLPGLPGDALVVSVYDADGALVAASPGGASPQEVVVTDFTGAMGDWSVEVSRAQGGAQAITYQLEVELRNGPA